MLKILLSSRIALVRAGPKANSVPSKVARPTVASGDRGHERARTGRPAVQARAATIRPRRGWHMAFVAPAVCCSAAPKVAAMTGAPPLLALAGMVGMAVAMGIGRFVYTPILPGMMDELGLSPADAGWIASANYLGYLLGAFAAAGGWAAGRERRLCWWPRGECLLAAAMAGRIAWPPLLIRFLAGLASAFVMIFLASIVFSRLRRRTQRPAGHAFRRCRHRHRDLVADDAALVTVAAHWPAGWFWSA